MTPSRPLEFLIDAVGIDLPDPSPTATGASLLDPVPMVRQDLDEMGHRRSPGDQAEDLGIAAQDSGALGRLAGDAFVLGEHDESVVARIVDPRLVVSFLRPCGTVDVDKSGRGPSELSAGARHQVGRQTAIDQDARPKLLGWRRRTPC